MAGTQEAETAAWYRRWALVETHGASPTYEHLALAVAGDPATLEVLEQVEMARRQPNLLFAALRWHSAPVEEPLAALAWIGEHREQVLQVLRTRATQTNEPARCAVLLPALAQLAAAHPGPLAVVEVGASAGLCLLYDAWRYRWRTADCEHWAGPLDSPLVLDCAVDGPAPLPADVPPIAWRAGLDLHPLDPADPGDRRWLHCLVWPEHTRRAENLLTALDVAAGQRPTVQQGDMTRDLAGLLTQAQEAAHPARPGVPVTVVVTHSAALTYLDASQRSEVLATIAAAGAHRLGAEAPSVLPSVAARLPAGLEVGGQFVVSVDDQPLALAHPHGSTLTWL